MRGEDFVFKVLYNVQAFLENVYFLEKMIFLVFFSEGLPTLRVHRSVTRLTVHWAFLLAALFFKKVSFFLKNDKN